MARLLPSVSGYVYATDERGLYVNLFVASAGTITSPGGAKVPVTQETKYPWEGRVKITVGRKDGWPAEVKVRIPEWARETKLSLNGSPVEVKVQSGYATVALSDAPKAEITLEMPMPVERVRAHPLAKANVGRVAIQRGPVVYCMEGVDNKGADLFAVALPEDSKLEPEHRPDLLGGVTVIKAAAQVGEAGAWEEKLYAAVKPQTRDVTFVPYCTWDNREPGQMVVWLPTDVQAATRVVAKTIASESKASASHCFQNDTVEALHDQVEPKSSDDQSIRRFTWWPRQGSEEWVRYDFASPAKVSWCEVYWFQDNGGCRLPESWKVQYRDGEAWKDVEAIGEYPVKANGYNRATFKPVTTGGLRVVVKPKENYSGGILEWRVGG
jgi:hypothetical protein